MVDHMGVDAVTICADARGSRLGMSGTHIRAACYRRLWSLETRFSVLERACLLLQCSCGATATAERRSGAFHPQQRVPSPLRRKYAAASLAPQISECVVASIGGMWRRLLGRSHVGLTRAVFSSQKKEASDGLAAAKTS